MAATFFFRAVAADGKIRNGSLSGDNEKSVAKDLRKQGLIPVYVGATPKNVSLEIVEDPVQYQMDGINRIHVNPQIGHLRGQPPAHRPSGPRRHHGR